MPLKYNTNKNTAGATFKGFSSRSTNTNFKLYDFDLIKQDILNRLSVRKGERVENPEFGTVIYDAIHEPFTNLLRQAIIDDVVANMTADPRVSVDNIQVSETGTGISVEASITYIPYNITEQLVLGFNEQALSNLS